MPPRSNPRVEQAKAVLSAVLKRIDVPTRFPYAVWEEAFIETWTLVPDFNSMLAKKYMDMEGLDRMSLTCYEAIRAWHVNQFMPMPIALSHRWAKMELDLNGIADKLVEPELTEEDLVRVDKQRLLHDPNNPARRRRVMMDMSPDRNPQQQIWKPGK